MAGDEKNHDNHESSTLSDIGGSIDMDTFGQILEMDDSEDDRDFSSTIVFEFFDQAKDMFKQMDAALESKNFNMLYQLGQFLKGSSATIGMTKVKDSCEKIQRYGKKENEDGSRQHNEELLLSQLTETIKQAKKEYAEGEAALRKFYEDQHAGM